MKKSLFSLLLAVLFFSANAQQHTCFTQELVDRKRATDPNYDQGMRLQEDALRKFMATQMQDPSFSARAVRTIPVAVHVIYNTAAQNVTDAAVQQMITRINLDYRKQNTDFSTARTAVQLLAADAQIEFCLATVKPNGTATNGIEHVQTSKSCFNYNTESDDMKYASSNGADAWDPNRYLNIWVVDICGSSPSTGGVGGYAYVAASNNGLHGQSYDGIVIEYSMGMGSTNRTWTHEIGHYLGLHHTWGDNASNACGNVFPTTDDGFSDTPDSRAANFGCSYITSCTGNSAYGDQIENYMDYSNCTVMFTTQQANYMNSILTGTRSPLVTNNNKCTVTGAPVASFTASPTSICSGQTVSFTNTTTGSGTITYSWTFTGGTPATSTAANPTITYNTAGTYNVSLTATNANGANTSTQTALVTVAGTGSALPLIEGFESTTFPPTGWARLNSDNATTWARTTSASGFGTSTAAAYVSNFDYNAAGQKDWLITPSYNFTTAGNARIRWDYAYAPYTQAGYSDSLVVLYSTNCGGSWTTLWARGGTSLGTATASANSFLPTAAQWRKDSVSLASLTGQSNVRFAFKNACAYGNNIFLDNVNVYSTTTPQAVTPVANFIGTPTTVVVGNTVAFTDLSTNTPTSWSWSFTGGTPATSTSQNPTITYNTAGVYPVTLTATNAGGSNPNTKTAYITVLAAGGTQSCDTLSNIFAADTLTLYTYSSPASGFVTGHNSYLTKSQAEFYTNPSPGSSVTGALFYFGKAETLNPATATITARVWNANGVGGLPNTVLASQSVLINSIIPNVVNNSLTFVNFTTPAVVTGNFYVGYEMTYANGDTVAIVSTTFNSPSGGKGFVQWSNNTWYPYDSLFGNNLSSVMLPILCTAQTGAAPVASFTANNTAVCAGSTVNFTSTSTGSPTSYSWSFTGGTPATSSNPTPAVVYNTPGTYNVSLTVSNANGNNTSTRTNYITVYAKPSLTTSSTSVLCFGGSTGSATVTATGFPTFTYNWSGGGNTANISNKAANTYTVTVTDGRQCTATASVNVAQPLSALTATASSSNASCNQANGSVTATPAGGAGGYTYLWNTGANTAIVSNLATGTYTLTVRDANNCSALATATINSSANNLGVSIQATNATCGLSNGTAAALPTAVNFTGTYSWNNSATSANITSLAAGTYTVTITSSTGCTASASTSITNTSSNLSVTFTSNPAACSQSNGSITANVTGGSGGLAYNWNGGGTTATISNLAAGSYTVTVTDNSSCSVSAIGTVSNANAPIVTVTQTAPLCFAGNTGSATASATGGTTPYTFVWSSGTSGASANNLTGGNTYVVSVTDAGQCLTVRSVTITNPAAINVSITSTNALCGQQNGSATALATGGTGTLNYAWSNQGNQVGISNLAAGSYSVTVRDANQCSATSSTQITTVAGPTSVLNAINGTCQISAQINLTVLNGTSPFTYVWSNGAVTEDIQNLNAGNYIVTITDANGCINVNNTAVTDASSVNVAFTSQNPSQGNTDGSITATPSGGSAPYSFNWSTGSQLQTVSNLGVGTYTVTVTDNAGCTKISTVTLTIISGLTTVEDIALFKIYPNPAKNVCSIYIELSKAQNLNLQMYNNLGQVVWAKQETDFTQGIETVDVSNFSAGVYFVRITMNGNQHAIRFVKE